MGCESDKVITSNQIQRNPIDAKSLIIPTHKYGNEKFSDYPEWEGERYKGIGIKRMKGYICTIPINELNKKREEFWAYQVSRNKTWKIIRQICAMDNCIITILYNTSIIVRAIGYFQQFKYQTVNDCINHFVDERGNQYFIPNYCINDPYFEKMLPEVNEQTEDKIVEIILVEMLAYREKMFKVSSMSTGKEIKDMYMKECGYDQNAFTLRLLFGGNEIKENEILAQYKIDNGYKIQVLKRERIIEENKEDKNNNDDKVVMRNEYGGFE